LCTGTFKIQTLDPDPHEGLSGSDTLVSDAQLRIGVQESGAAGGEPELLRPHGAGDAGGRGQLLALPAP